VSVQRVFAKRFKRGDFALADHLLGRPFSISGHIKHGDKIGRTLDFPTANISLKRQVSPLAGIYTVKVWGLDDKPLLGAANVGTRPAVMAKKIVSKSIFRFSRRYLWSPDSCAVLP
jgi:FAD synthase